MKHRIIAITHKDGTPRMDGRYPQRINSVVEVVHCEAGKRLGVMYHKDGKGLDKSGVLWTSPIENYEEDGGAFMVETKNSIYHFEMVKEDN